MTKISLRVQTSRNLKRPANALALTRSNMILYLQIVAKGRTILSMPNVLKRKTSKRRDSNRLEV